MRALAALALLALFLPGARRAIPALVLALAAPSAARAESDALSAALQAKAPSVLEHVRKKGFKNVGVLKFLVRRGDGPLTDDAGEMNTSLAKKTQVALVLANTDEDFGIIDNPSEFIAREKLSAANHRTVEGRRAFFTIGRKYELAWSRDVVEASGFITGTVTLTQNLDRMTIRLQVFDKTGAIEDLPGEITAQPDPEMLAQAGFSYTIPVAQQKALVAGDPVPSKEARQKEAVDGMLRVSDPPKPTNPMTKLEPFAPLVDCPVKWTVLYNGRPMAVSGNTVPEPGPNDAVAFHLRNPGPGTYAVVLMVNGQNTLYQERQAPLVCRKWVLPPGAEVTVRGFQVNSNRVAPFVVLPPEEVDPDEFRYGEHAGTYRLVVYHGKTSTTPPDDSVVAGLNADDTASLAIARTRGATRPEGVKPQSLAALQADLRGRVKSAEGSRGYVTKGKTTDVFETEAVYFVPSSDTPVSDISLRYFTPKK
ncbi:MAG TPA: hypothetical protein VKE74_33195 [Gemmataceae bacterium]|nr:hypothetical protein [Gemmataceae bacterium]